MRAPSVNKWNQASDGAGNMEAVSEMAKEAGEEKKAAAGAAVEAGQSGGGAADGSAGGGVSEAGAPGEGAAVVQAGDKEKALQAERAKRKSERDRRQAAESEVQRLTEQLASAKRNPGDPNALKTAALDGLDEDALNDPAKVREAIRQDLASAASQIRDELGQYGERERGVREIRGLLDSHEIFSDPDYGDIARDTLKARVMAAGEDANLEEIVQSVARRVSDVAVSRENARSGASGDGDDFEPPPPGGSPGAAALLEYSGGRKPKTMDELREAGRSAARSIASRFRRGRR